MVLFSLVVRLVFKIHYFKGKLFFILMDNLAGKEIKCFLPGDPPIPLWDIGEPEFLVDAYGDKYFFDEGLPGLESIWALSNKSPYVKASRLHDLSFSRAKYGYKLPTDTALGISVQFAKDATEAAGEALVKALKGENIIQNLGNVSILPAIILLGSGYGYFRYKTLDKQQQTKRENIK